MADNPFEDNFKACHPLILDRGNFLFLYTTLLHFKNGYEGNVNSPSSDKTILMALKSSQEKKSFLSFTVFAGT